MRYPLNDDDNEHEYNDCLSQDAIAADATPTFALPDRSPTPTFALPDSSPYAVEDIWRDTPLLESLHRTAERAGGWNRGAPEAQDVVADVLADLFADPTTAELPRQMLIEKAWRQIANSARKAARSMRHLVALDDNYDEADDEADDEAPGQQRIDIDALVVLLRQRASNRPEVLQR